MYVKGVNWAESRFDPGFAWVGIERVLWYGHLDSLLSPHIDNYMCPTVSCLSS